MINLAVFIEFKQNEISNNSISLLNFANSLRENNSDINIFLYTLQDINHCEVPKNILVELVTSVKDENNVYFSTNSSLDCLVSHLKKNSISHVFCTKSITNDSVSSKLSVMLGFDLVNNIKSLKIENNIFYYSKSFFSGKAIANLKGTSESNIAVFPKGFTGECLSDDQIQFKEIKTEKLIITEESTSKIIEISTLQSGIQLSEAEIVVGAGRGLKDPNNWGIIETLALKIKAATACSKPVSDLNWRPHHEHVGQTGIKISPKLYIACGISGAIQHLAGVNGSGTIVVINNDSEAPFMKYADYVVLGDLFEIIPQLTKLFDEA